MSDKELFEDPEGCTHLLTNDQLREIARKHPPPPKWFKEDDEVPASNRERLRDEILLSVLPHFLRESGVMYPIIKTERGEVPNPDALDAATNALNFVDIVMKERGNRDSGTLREEG